MSDIVLDVAGRSYRVRAKDGEEDKLVRAGHLVEDRCVKARAALGTLSDASLYFYAALMLADDLAEGAPVPAPADGEATRKALALAERLEALADRLEQGDA